MAAHPGHVTLLLTIYRRHTWPPLSHYIVANSANKAGKIYICTLDLPPRLILGEMLRSLSSAINEPCFRSPRFSRTRASGSPFSTCIRLPPRPNGRILLPFQFSHGSVPCLTSSNTHPATYAAKLEPHRHALRNSCGVAAPHRQPVGIRGVVPAFRHVPLRHRRSAQAAHRRCDAHARALTRGTSCMRALQVRLLMSIMHEACTPRE